MTESKTHAGRCFCGTVEIAVSGEPVGMGYCHCQSCRSWSAGPVNAFTLWPPEAVRVTKGIDNVGSYRKSDNSGRKWCKICGGHLITEPPQWELIDGYAATISRGSLKPGGHVDYPGTGVPRRG